MRSKALVRFLNRAARFDADLEIVDVIGIAIEEGRLTPSDEARLFEFVDPQAHPRLAKAKATAQNRQIVVGHLRKTVYSSYVKDLYEDFTDYLDELISSAARKGLSPQQLRGEFKLQLSADEVLECGDWDSVTSMIARALLGRLHDMGNAKRMTFLDKRLGLGLDPEVVGPAMAYLDLRHLLVHTDGLADAEFCQRYPVLGAYPNEPVKLTMQTANDARLTITALVEHVDERAVAASILASEDLQ